MSNYSDFGKWVKVVPDSKFLNVKLQFKITNWLKNANI